MPCQVGVFVTDVAQMFGLVLVADDAGECDGLIASDARAAIYAIYWSRVFDLTRVTKRACA